MTTVGFVGLGHMGGNMAARLLAAGYEVYGEERHREHALDLEEAGLRWRDTPREVAEAAEIVLTSLPDDEALESAASGPDGILAGLAADKVWVDVSTVSPRVSRELAGRARARGAAFKLAINISLAVQMLAYSEGLLLATRFGVDPTVATRVMT